MNESVKNNDNFPHEKDDSLIGYAADSGDSDTDDSDLILMLSNRFDSDKGFAIWDIIKSVIVLLLILWFMDGAYGYISEASGKIPEVAFWLAVITGLFAGIYFGHYSERLISGVFGAFGKKKSQRRDVLLVKYYHRCAELEAELETLRGKQRNS